jgi:Protein of unknown function (DUF1579)
MENAMRATLIAMSLTVVLVPGLTWADDTARPPSPAAVFKALAEAGKPGPEHQKLQPFVGDWDFTLKLWTDPNQSPAELKGTISRKWIMDGRFVQETVKGECATTGKTFEGLGLLGYDSGQKKFTSVRACGICGTISSNLVSADSSGKKFTCATEECCPLSGQTVKGRDEIIIENSNRIVTNVYKNLDGKEVKTAEIVAIRK